MLNRDHVSYRLWVYYKAEVQIWVVQHEDEAGGGRLCRGSDCILCKLKCQEYPLIDYGFKLWVYWGDNDFVLMAADVF